MKKRTFFKILLCGLLVFLLLPAVFDEEDKKPQQKSAFEEATSFDPSEDVDDIPIVEGNGAKESIFKKYSRKFKKMYGKVLFGVPAEEQDGASFAKAKEQAADDDDNDLSSAMSYLLSDDKSDLGRARSSYNEDYEEETIGALFYDSYTDSYVIGSSAPVKQTMHDNAPVKGLYETSFIESPESKVKANQVYSSVMRKVDTPSAITRGSAVSEKKGVSVENLPENNEFDSAQSNVVKSNNNLKTFSRQYTGISSRNSKDSGKANRGGELYSYNKGSFGNLGGLGQLADMETVASHVAGRVSSAANTMKEERIATRANEGNDAPQQGYEGNTADADVPAPQDNKPEEEKPFDASLYPEITATELSECVEEEEISLWDDEPEAEESDAKEKTDPKSEVKTEGESPAVKDDTIKSCDKDAIFEDNQVRKEIGAAEGQNLVIVDLGVMNVNGKPMRRTLTADINTNLSVSGLHRIGIDNLTGGERINNVFSAISDRDFKRYVRDYNKIAVIITNDPKIQQTYSNRAVLIQDGDLKSAEKLKSLAANLNQIDISAVRGSLIAEAQEREIERSNQYKGEVAGAGKYITED